jgi:hypothetical protein
VVTQPAQRVARGAWLTAGAVVALLLAVSARYGFHRDELYFVVAGRRLDWGYVDQPPLTPLVARLADAVGGSTPIALRVLPAFAIGAVVLLAASMARELGGGRRAQVFAGVAAGGSGIALAVGHLLSTTSLDYLLWTLATWILVRLLAGADPRWWLALGVTTGVGLLNKHLIGLFAVAVLIGLLMTRQRTLLASRWPWVGAGIAALLALPNLLWQLANGLPQLEMSAALARRSDGPLAFVLEQVGLLSIALVVPAAVGVWNLLRDPQLERWRPIGISFVVLFTVFVLVGGKSYYVAPMYPVALAAGSLWFEQLRGAARASVIGASAVGIVAGTFIALPLLPASAVAGIDATGELGETVGWPELIEQVRTVHLSIPGSQRADVAIFTGSYGEAGAIDVLGPELGLPRAYSGHNNYWLWGPPTSHGPIIGVGAVGDVLRGICPDTRQVDTISNPHGVENEEFGLPLYLCLSPERQLGDVWRDLKHYN